MRDINIKIVYSKDRKIYVPKSTKYMHTPSIPLYPYLLCLIEELEKLNLTDEVTMKSILSFFIPGIQTIIKGQVDLNVTPAAGKTTTTLFEGNKYREILESIGRNKRHMPDMLSFKV